MRALLVIVALYRVMGLISVQNMKNLVHWKDGSVTM